MNLALLLGVTFWAIGFGTIGCAIVLSKEYNEKINKNFKKIVDKENTKVIYLKYKKQHKDDRGSQVLI